MKTFDELSNTIIGAAIQVHRILGPGLLESAYEECLKFELEQKKLKVESQKGVPIVYKTIQLECGYRLDLLVEDQVIIEVKSVESFAPVHTAQILTYMRLSEKHLGLLINFNVMMLKDGIKRYVR
jgi:GxxExxY protein